MGLSSESEAKFYKLYKEIKSPEPELECSNLIIQAVFDIETIDLLSSNIPDRLKQMMKEEILKEYYNKFEKNFCCTKASPDKIRKYIDEVMKDYNLSEDEKLHQVSNIKSHDNSLNKKIEVEEKCIDKQPIELSGDSDELLDIDDIPDIDNFIDDENLPEDNIDDLSDEDDFPNFDDICEASKRPRFNLFRKDR